MANENKEIGDIVKKCKILLLDIEGTTTSISFVKDKLFPYAEENVKQFLDSQWESESVKEVVTALRKLAIEDQAGSVEGVVSIPGEDASKEEQIEGLVNNVKWQMSADRKAGPLKQLQGLIWKQGYDAGDIKGHVFDDVSAALEAWHSAEGQKVYIYSSGSVQAQKLLFGQSLAGDLLRFIDGHFDTAVGAKQEADSYKKIVEEIGCKPDEVLFLTDIVKEAEAARSAGVHSALVSRSGNAPLPADAVACFPVIHSLADLTLSNKRKQEVQEEVPAKIPKKDSEEVKVAPEEVEMKEGAPEKNPTAETEPTQPASTETASKDTEETEKMEVESDVPIVEKQIPDKEQVIVEEMTDSNGVDVPVCDIEPVVVETEMAEEKESKTDSKETDKPTEEPKKETEASVEKETAVVTEIEEVSEKQLEDVAEVMDDVVPVVEEPDQTEEMEDLQNVGEVLEKECDEILSKVNNVTNLENIPVKPMLNTIDEENMETDNTDSNDIVDRILDTELDLEMKQCTDIDVNTVSEMTEEAKTDDVEEKVTEASPSEVPETAEKVEANNVTEEKKEESSPKETEQVEVKETEIKKLPVKSSCETTETTETTIEEKKDKVTEEKAEEVVNAEVKSDKTASEKTTKEESTVTEVKDDVKCEEKTTPTVESEQTAAKEVKTTEPALEGKMETEQHGDTKLNGSATNGDTAKVENGTKALNGDTSKDEELNARLTENGKVNGSNGDSLEIEQGQGDCKGEVAVTDIKVKTVAVAEETPTDPIEQPTEA